jgi:hypothetical protein
VVIQQLSSVSGFMQSWSRDRWQRVLFFKKNHFWSFFTQSGRENWVSENYKTIDVNGNSYNVEIGT